MSREFDALLAQALARMGSGEDLQGILADAGDDRLELESLLRVALSARVVLRFDEPPSDAAMDANRRRLLRTATRQWASKPEPWWRRRAWHLPARVPRPSHSLATAALLAALLAVAATVTTVAASGTLPGDTLYPVKLAAEEVQLAITFDPPARDRLETEIAQTRRDEAQAVVAAGRLTDVRFEGEFEGFDLDAWVVGGLTILVDDQTIIEGQPVPGVSAVVEALSPGDGTLRATRLLLQPPDVPDVRGPAQLATTTPARSFTPAPVQSRTPAPTDELARIAAPATQTQPPPPSGTATPVSVATPSASPDSPAQRPRDDDMMQRPMTTQSSTSDHDGRPTQAVPTGMPMPTRWQEPTHGPEPTRRDDRHMPTHIPMPHPTWRP